MDRKTLKVLGAGSALLDLVACVPDEFLKDASVGEKGGMVLLEPEPFLALLDKVKQAAGKIIQVPGGSTANILSGLSHAGIANALLVKTGKDERGDFYRTCYEEHGGDSRSFKTDPVLPTGCCLSLVTPDGQRTMRTCLGAAGSLSADDISEKDFEGITHLHLEGYLLPNTALFTKLTGLAKAHSCTVSMDLSSFEIVRAFRDTLKNVIRDWVDLVFCNEDEAAAFAPGYKPEEALGVLASLCRTAIVTLGKKGALVRTGDQITKVDAGTAKAVDTTGAGDLWQSGFLYGWLRGEPDAGSGRFASAVAEEVIQVTGSKIPEERWDFLLRQFTEIEKQQ